MARVEEWLTSRCEEPAAVDIQFEVLVYELAAMAVLIERRIAQQLEGCARGSNDTPFSKRRPQTEDATDPFPAAERQRMFEIAKRVDGGTEKIERAIARVEALLRAPPVEQPGAPAPEPPGRQIRAPGLSESEQRLMPGLSLVGDRPT